MEPFYALIVFLQLEPARRMERLRQRELERYGERILSGGDMAGAHQTFIEWAASYDRAGPERRSLAAHEAWLITQQARILRLDSAAPVAQLQAAVLSALDTFADDVT